MVSVFFFGLAFANHICSLKHFSFLESIINRSFFNQELKRGFPSYTNCAINMKPFVMVFPAEPAPPSPADRCLHGPSSYLRLCGVNWSELQDGVTTPRPLLSPRRWFDPLRAQPNLREWTWSAARPRSSLSSVSSFSRFLLRLGRFKSLMYRCVCV